MRFTERGWRFSSKISRSILPSVSLENRKKITVTNTLEHRREKVRVCQK